MALIDKEHYLQIARTQGANAALTALHLDTEKLELESFEGKKGWSPEMFEELKTVRDFSRDLWEAAVLQAEARESAER